MKNLRIGGTDVGEHIEEQVALAIAKQLKQMTPDEFLQMCDEELKTDPLYVHKMFRVMGTNQIPEIAETTSLNKKYNEEIKRINLERKADSILLSSKPPAKWYDNIPEQGVLCWCKEYEEDVKCKRLLERIDEYTEGRFLSRTTGFLYKTVQPLTNEEIEEFKR